MPASTDTPARTPNLRAALNPATARPPAECPHCGCKRVTRKGIMTASMEAVDLFAFDNSYARLPDRFFARLRPTPVSTPRLVRLNENLAWHLELDPVKLATPEGVEILAGNRMPARGEPLAMAYAGHQFGTFVPQLGDGRAILLGEIIDRDGVRRDIQLKGSGLRRPQGRHGTRGFFGLGNLAADDLAVERKIPSRTLGS